MNCAERTTSDPLRELLESLNGDDPRRARQALEKYEPYLRMVIRRHLRGPLRSKIDSMDVVQSIWVYLCREDRPGHWRFNDVGELRRFLARVARNRLIDYGRRHRRSLEAVRPLELVPARDLPRHTGPRASQVVVGDEMRDRLLMACAPAHRDIIRMKLDGRLLGEIAQATGLHEGSVRRVLYAFAKRFKAPISEDEGN